MRIPAMPRPGLAPAAAVVVATLCGCSTDRGSAPHGAAVAVRPAPAPEPEIPTAPLSIFDAVGLALRQNPDLAAAAGRIAQAEAGLAEAKASYWPVLSLDFGFLHGDSPSAYLFKTIDARTLEPGTDFNDPGTFTNYELGGTLNWNLFRGGARLYEERIARTERALGELGRTALENRLISAVIHAYHDVLAAGEFLATARASVQTVEAQRSEVQKRFEGGAAGTLKADLLALEVRLAEARERELGAANARSLALAALNNLLGLEPHRPIELSGEEWRPRPLPGSYEAALAEALEKRPELGAARAAVDRANHAKDVEWAGFLPRLDLVGRSYWDDPELKYSGRDDLNWTVAALFSWEIFRGGGRRARLARASARIDEMRALDRKALLDVELDVRTAFLRMEEARARLEVAEKSVALAEESLDQSGKLYRGGAATVTRYLEAELALTAARLRVTQARYDLKKASADLARAMGWCTECAKKEVER